MFSFHNIDQITEKLYLGNLSAAEDTQNLKELGIKKVLSILDEFAWPKYHETLNIEHKKIAAQDMDDQNIIKYFGECLLFIDDDKKTLVHCFAGSSRSATIIIAYLMWKNQLDYVESCHFLRKIRPIVYPNYGFIRQLKMFDKLLKKNNYDINKINFKEINFPRFFEECCF